jgi:hypothetical protein
MSYSHNAVAHMWANQTKDSARGNNIFFQGDKIFSYGSHFEIARHVGINNVLFTACDYSVTTAQHKNIVRRACSHKRIFTVPYFDALASNIPWYCNQIDEWMKTEEAELMRKLVTIPFFDMPVLDFNFKDFDKEVFLRDNFIKLCLSYDFKSFLREEQDWVKTFNMV